MTLLVGRRRGFPWFRWAREPVFFVRLVINWDRDKEVLMTLTRSI